LTLNDIHLLVSTNSFQAYGALFKDQFAIKTILVSPNEGLNKRISFFLHYYTLSKQMF